MNIIYLLLILLMLVMECRIYNNLLTPSMLLYGVITFLLILSKLLDVEFNLSNYILTLFKLNLMWFIISIMMRIVFYKYDDCLNIENKKLFNDKVVMTISVVIEILFFFEILKQAQINGIGNLKGKIGGIAGHLYNLFFPYFSIVLIKKKFLNLLIFFIMLCFLILCGGKYLIFLILLPYILYTCEQENNVIFFLKKILLLLIIIIIVFGSVYFINFYLKHFEFTSNSFINFLLQHIKYYLLSPIYIANYLLEHPENGNIEQTFAPFINIYRVITGNKNYISSILPYFTYLDITSNVGGIIGELVYNIGFTGMYIYMFFLGIFVYFFENLLKIDRIWLYCTIFIKSILILCFFINMFILLNCIEQLLGIIFLTLLSKEWSRIHL